jgi:hypothetical protein
MTRKQSHHFPLNLFYQGPFDFAQGKLRPHLLFSPASRANGQWRPQRPPLIGKSAGCVIFSHGRERETRYAYLAIHDAPPPPLLPAPANGGRP